MNLNKEKEKSINYNKNKHPFYSDVFVSNWISFFLKQPRYFSFNFLTPVNFVKSKYSLYYYNIGKNITNGILYNIEEGETDYHKKVFLLYDVLSNRNEIANLESSRLKIKKVKQYKGYQSSLSGYETFDEYFEKQFSSKSRYNLRKYNKKLENNFNISFKVYCGSIAKGEYDSLFSRLINLIEKRFGELGQHNNILKLREYYYQLSYKMILERKASLNILYDNDEPIAISLCFLSNKEVYFAITTFDTAYKRYNLGHMLIIKIMQWCFDNDFTVFDYSKGTYDYKKRWSNESYDFENHIIYDSKSLKSIIVGNYLYNYFKFKQYLRNKNINKLYSKIKFLLKKKNNAGAVNDINVVKIKEENFFVHEYKKINLLSNKYKAMRIRPIVNDVLFSNSQPIDSIFLYEHRELKNNYIISGKKLLVKVLFE